MSDLGNYVKIVAGGDPVIVNASGFPSYSTTRVPDLSAPGAPTDFRLCSGDLSGAAIARYQATRSNSMNQVQSCIGDPNVEVNWKDAGMFSRGKATLSGIVPGANLWVRVRTPRAKRRMVAWSDPANIMVT